ncbi:MAG: hypothetical protein AAFU41_14155 [Pseudomonadota bacterium]
MTALDKYVRLESGALWRATPEAQRRDVTISFGDATLVIADGAGRPLAHWSLPALIRQNPEEMPAIYTPDEDASELIEIADETMVEAIEEVRAALEKQRPHPGKLRLWLALGVLAVSVLLAVFWLPGALTRQTLAVVPEPKRVAIGQTILANMTTQTGGVCQTDRAEAAAQRLAVRLFGPQTSARIVVLPNLAAASVALPGGIFALDAGVLQSADDPAVAAGFVLAAQAALKKETPLAGVLDRAGLGATFRLLTTGEVQPQIMQAEAVRALSPAEVPTDVLQDLMVASQIPQAPYLAALDAQTGSMPNLGPDPLEGTEIPLILNDSDWVSLQNVCNG